jgi:phosphinothricin acetyltransferase
MIIRDAEESDMAAIRDIYAHYATKGLATFEETAPSVDDMIGRLRAARDAGYPYIVAELDGEIGGYSYASTYRPRPAYRFTVENSVYVSDGMGGRGIGSTLLAELIARCEAGPWQQMIAVIGNSGNAGSIALHEKFGFSYVGTLRSVGFKLDQWVDTVLMQRSIKGDSH